MRRLLCWLRLGHDWRLEPARVDGVTLGWHMLPQVTFSSVRACTRCGALKIQPGWIYPVNYDRVVHRGYYPDGDGTWPRDPKTGARLPIASP